MLVLCCGDVELFPALNNTHFEEIPSFTGDFSMPIPIPPIPPLADRRRVVARGDALLPETLDPATPATAVELEEAE